MTDKAPTPTPFTMEEAGDCRLDYMRENAALKQEIARLREQLDERNAQTCRLVANEHVALLRAEARCSQLAAARESILQEAAKAVCGYCADPERWQPAKKGTYPEWWHLSTERTFNVRNQCSAWAIWHMIEREALAESEEEKGQ